ncbi:MAG: 3'-5' exonuclease, partial [Candidatus Omnitrophica bacterium]|nr:3'-5' exonuclease [Candidatus Omnitrophota bacterium]
LSGFEGSEEAAGPGYDGGYVKVALRDKEEDDEATRAGVIACIKSLTARFDLSDIAILTRTNDDVALVTEWLLEEGIPVESERTLDISAHFLIKELISFLTFLELPIDDMAFAGFILGEIFETASGLKREEIAQFIFEANTAEAAGGTERGPLYKAFRRAYPELWDRYINVLFKKAGTMPLYEFVVSITNIYGIFEHFASHQAFLMRLLELIKEKEDDCISIGAFLEYLNEAPVKDLFVRVKSSGAVRALTVHQAKGLQFGVTIVPFLSMNPKVGSSDDFGYKRSGRSRGRPYVVRSDGENIQLVYLSKNHIGFSEKLRELYEEEYTKALIDELNTAYVALTRAQYEMYIFVPLKAGTKTNSMRLLLPNDRFEWGKEIAYPERKAKDAAKVLPLSPSRLHDWIPFIKQEFSGGREVMRRESILRGDIIHYILSCVGNLHGADVDAVIEEALKQGTARFRHVDPIKPYESVIRALLNDRRFAFIFYAEKGRVFREKQVVTAGGEMRIIDRVIVTDTTVDIVDYKSSAAPDLAAAYRAQIAEYKSLMGELYPGRDVRGFLLYLDTFTTEEL